MQLRRKKAGKTDQQTLLETDWKGTVPVQMDDKSSGPKTRQDSKPNG